jgi:hypothetical protein
MSSPSAIRPPGFTPPVIRSSPGIGVASDSCATAPEKVPTARTIPDLAPQQSADAKPAALNHVASPTGQILTRLPPAASVARTAYLTAQDRKPALTSLQMETVARSEQARVAPGQIFMASLARAVASFFQWVTGLTQSKIEDDDRSPEPASDGSRPSPGPGIDTRV